MRRYRRRLAAIVLGCVAALAPASPALAHGGDAAKLTSNYRTRITELTAVDGLDVRVIDIEGTIELTWHGPGALTVTGYEGEPYLRIDNSGVAQNMRSPATYLNQDRYAQVDLPDSVDADATPVWQTVSGERLARWHDHRTHWMSPVPPLEVQANDRTSHVIYERWEIPLDVAGRPAVIAGDLTWSPPPPTVLWLIVVVTVVGIAAGMLWTRRWPVAAAVLAVIAASAMTVDTIGVAARMHDTITNRAWAFAYCVVAAGASAWLVVHAWRRTPSPTLAMMIAGLVLTVMGGLTRLGVFTSSYQFSAVDVGTSRVAVAICLGVGVALLARFIRFLAPLVVRPTSSASRPLEESNA